MFRFTHQILKLKLGPQDSNGIMEMNINGINSPRSVVWRKSNVSGILSFFSPLKTTTTTKIIIFSSRNRAQSFQTYPSNSKTICSSSNPPTTLNLRKLHTCVFSYFPNLICFTIAGRCSFNVRNCGGVLVFDDHRDTWLLGQSSRIFL